MGAAVTAPRCRPSREGTWRQRDLLVHALDVPASKLRLLRV